MPWKNNLMYLPIKKNSKTIVLYVLIILFAYSSAVALSGIQRERTLGSIFRHFLPAAPILFLIVLINLCSIENFSFSSFIPRFQSNQELKRLIKSFVLISIIAIPVGLFTFQYIVKGSTLVGPVVLLLFISLFIACFYMMVEKSISAIIIYITAIPFLYFTQRQFYMFGLEKEALTISKITVPLSVIYLLIISIFFFIGQYKVKLNASNEEKRFIKICVFFILFPLFSVIFSEDSLHSFVYYLVDLVFPFIFFLILMKSLRNIKDIKRFTFYFVTSVCSFSFFSLYYRYQMGSIKHITVGLYGMKNITFTGFFAAHLCFQLPLIIAIFSLIKGWKKAFLGLLIIFSLIFIILSQNRASPFVLCVGLIIFIYYYKIPLTRKIYITAGLLLCLIILGLYIPEGFKKISHHRFIQLFQAPSKGIALSEISAERTHIWKSSLEMIRDFPIFGIGPDMWRQHIPNYSYTSYFRRDIFHNRIRYYSNSPHNVYLMMWLYYGAISFIFFVFILYLSMRRGLRNIKWSTSYEIKKLSLASFISLVMWATYSITGGRFYVSENILFGLIFWAIIALIFKLREIQLVPKTQD